LQMKLNDFVEKVLHEGLDDCAENLRQGYLKQAKSLVDLFLRSLRETALLEKETKEGGGWLIEKKKYSAWKNVKFFKKTLGELFWKIQKEYGRAYADMVLADVCGKFNILDVDGYAADMLGDHIKEKEGLFESMENVYQQMWSI